MTEQIYEVAGKKTKNGEKVLTSPIKGDNMQICKQKDPNSRQN